MTIHQKLFSVSFSLVIFISIILLVKRGRLREEFSGIWLLVGGLILLPVLWYDALVYITRLMGAVLPTTALFILGVVLLLVICLHLAVRVSRLSDQVKNLAQLVSLMESHAVPSSGTKRSSTQRPSPADR